MTQRFFRDKRVSKAIQKPCFLCSLIITHDISFTQQIQPRVSIKNPSWYEQASSKRQSEINEKFSGLISRKMVKTPCPQRAPNQSTFLWFHMRVVKLNNEWGLASWAGLLGVRLSIPSCFDVWRQPPIMESIIAWCSLFRPL